MLQVLNDRLIDLLIKKESGEITLEEQLELSELIKKDTSDALLAEGMSEVLGSSLIYTDQLQGGALNNGLDRIRAKIKASEPVPIVKKRKYIRAYFAVAASVVLIIAGTFFIGCRWLSKQNMLIILLLQRKDPRPTWCCRMELKYG
ncbi:hypothetical protein [Niabella hibiscisoli]|uniref:hypothetical protein n=1 Tax=Niabella hibiscisoli TaxID=1825928 RepID=UPI001F1046E0|nr:hypothetical protein [Niabella hibiscisoli]MCH5720243.1 hypothetical protein [Niabella hibiscisoli]